MNALTNIRLSVNGEELVVPVPPLMTLADLLRTQLGLNGTNLGCEEGVCGSCTVLVEGRTLRACLTLAAQLEGRSVTTIEGFAAIPDLRAVQQAFVRHFAAQCGFCTPGMMAVAAEFVAETKGSKVSDETIRTALDSAICRCTGYQAIVTAVRSLVQNKDRPHER